MSIRRPRSMGRPQNACTLSMCLHLASLGLPAVRPSLLIYPGIGNQLPCPEASADSCMIASSKLDLADLVKHSGEQRAATDWNDPMTAMSEAGKYHSVCIRHRRSRDETSGSSGKDKPSHLPMALIEDKAASLCNKHCRPAQHRHLTCTAICRG